MNALAVEIAAREGARIVWMPTVDSPAETAGRREPKPGDKVPQWARLQHELRELGLGVEPVHVTDADGSLLPETRDVLAHDRAPRADPRHGSPRPGRHLRRRRRSARGGRRDDRHHAPRVHLPELLDRGPDRARRARLPARALPDDAAQRQDDVGARLRRRARGRQRAHAVLERPREPGLPARRGRPRALGRSSARRGLRRGRGAGDDRRASHGGWQEPTHEQRPPASRSWGNHVSPTCPLLPESAGNLPVPHTPPRS